MTTTAIQKAAQAAGGQSALARKIGCTPQAVQRWCKTGFVPADRVVSVEQAVEGAVSRSELRPDLYVTAPPVEHAAA
ncbi:transcriptional regulator [Ralstonia syzygii]|uniref:transcriptional regulator n=1 Tax=Ralstonia syzygii TaxID=28097 RepID=UPI00351970FC